MIVDLRNRDLVGGICVRSYIITILRDGIHIIIIFVVIILKIK